MIKRKKSRYIKDVGGVFAGALHASTKPCTMQEEKWPRQLCLRASRSSAKIQP